MSHSPWMKIRKRKRANICIKCGKPHHKQTIDVLPRTTMGGIIEISVTNICRLLSSDIVLDCSRFLILDIYIFL